MTIAEFILAFASIIIGLGLSDLLLSFHRLLGAARRVKWDWLTLAFAALMIVFSVTLWWISWQWYHDVTRTDLAAFLPRLLFLCISFLLMAAALPDGVPENGVDLREFYWDSQVHRWSMMSLLLFLNVALIFWDDRDDFRLGLHFAWSPAVSMVLSAMCVRSRRIWLHVATMGWIAGVTLSNFLFYPINGA
jgi:hypothetical protein